MLSLTIQTLGPNPRIHTTNGVFRRRIASFPATLLSFSGDSGSPTVHSSCIREIRSKFRAIRATGGSNQVDDGGNYNAENTIHTNVVSWAQALLEFTEINFLPIGLAIFCCMPTTLSSGVALTNLVGGNSALALAMTVISNLLGIIFVPVSLSKFIGAGAGVSIPTMELFYSLVSTLMVPLILGKEKYTTYCHVIVPVQTPFYTGILSRNKLLLLGAYTPYAYKEKNSVADVLFLGISYGRRMLFERLQKI